jgi:hypothetical protein
VTGPGLGVDTAALEAPPTDTLLYVASRTESVLREPSNGPFQFWLTTSTVDDSAKTLPAGQRLVVNDSRCAVGDDDLLACIDGYQDGFVVSPRGSWAF